MIKKYVHQFSKELSKVQVACKNVKRHGPRLDLLEVMCSEQSELTKQVQRLGGKAQRFGKVQGDLKTTEGRNRLFNVMVTHRPRHLWYSPECGPWCQWSNMNMSKSVTACEAILTKRREQIWQVALGIVLFRFQEENKAHFDMEQPRVLHSGRLLGCPKFVRTHSGMNLTCAELVISEILRPRSRYGNA